VIRQYYAGRGRPMKGRIGLVGPVRAGSLLRIGGEMIRVLGWLPREYTAHHQDAAGLWKSVVIRGGHLALVERLRDKKQKTLADHILHAAEQA
jgi:hypothetical protein